MVSITQALLFVSFFIICESSICGEGFSCPDVTTCCPLSSGEWGCCPFVNAVCCDDNIHCCPEGTVCDASGIQCFRTNGDVFSPRKKSRAQQITEEREIICPDRRSKCPSGTTCCMLVSGRYGCCPVEGANCCADHLHCCPSGFTCDTSGQRCIQEKVFNVIGSFRKFPSTPLRNKPAVNMKQASEANPIHLADETADDVAPISCGYGKTCPAFTTCCEVLKHGQVHNMCCPLQNGVCCEDACCPAGYHCRKNGRCEKRAVRDYFIDDSF